MTAMIHRQERVVTRTNSSTRDGYYDETCRVRANGSTNSTINESEPITIIPISSSSSNTRQVKSLLSSSSSSSASVVVKKKNNNNDGKKNNMLFTSQHGHRIIQILIVVIFIYKVYFLFHGQQQQQQHHHHHLQMSPIVMNDENNINELIFVPFQFFYSCYNGFEQVACQHTILLDENNIDNTSQTMVGTNYDTTAETYNNVCDALWSLSTTTNAVVYIPVCIQGSTEFGIPLYKDNNDSKVHIIQSYDNTIIKHFIEKNSKAHPRIVTLKHVDFPSHYRGLVDTNNWLWERYRDDNYGNMVWRYSASMLLNQATTLVNPNDNWDNPNLATTNKVDALVVATANTLHITKEPKLLDHITTITNRIIYRNVPTIVVGVGIQFEFDNDNDINPMSQQDDILYDLNHTDLKLQYTFQTDFLKQASVHQTRSAIGVRGDMTQSICKNSGITNCISMGCPSLTLSRDINLGSTIQNNWYNVIQKMQNNDNIQIAVTFPAYATANDIAYTAVDFVLTILEKFPSGQVTIIQQDKADSIRMDKYIESVWKVLYPNSILHTNNINNINNFTINYEEYNNVESWIVGAKKYDLCLSSRIHGSMTFIGSGIPTIAIPTDFRIMELLVAMNVPHILPVTLRRLIQEDANKTTTMANNNSYNNRYDLILNVMDHAKNTNFTLFELNRRKKIQGWKNILDTAGLEIDPALVHILKTPM